MYFSAKGRERERETVWKKVLKNQSTWNMNTKHKTKRNEMKPKQLNPLFVSLFGFPSVLLACRKYECSFLPFRNFFCCQKSRKEIRKQEKQNPMHSVEISTSENTWRNLNAFGTYLNYALDFKSNEGKIWIVMAFIWERWRSKENKNVDGKLNAALILSCYSKMHDGGNYMNNAIDFW